MASATAILAPGSSLPVRRPIRPVVSEPATAMIALGRIAPDASAILSQLTDAEILKI